MDTARSSQSKDPRGKNCNNRAKTRQTPAVDPCEQKSGRRLRRREAKTDVDDAEKSKDNPLPESQTTSAEEQQGIKCAICVSNQNPKNMLRLLCGHCFHGSCLVYCFVSHLHCPVCRKRIDKVQFLAFIKVHSDFLRQQIPGKPKDNDYKKTVENMQELVKNFKQLEVLCYMSDRKPDVR